jgi:hypothetical protein
MPKSCTFINLQMFKCSQSTMECKVIAIVVNLAFIFYKWKYLVQQIKLFQQISKLYINGLFDCLVHLEQLHSNTHGHLGFTHKIDN